MDLRVFRFVFRSRPNHSWCVHFSVYKYAMNVVEITSSLFECMRIMKWMWQETNRLVENLQKSTRGLLKDWRDFWSAHKVLETDFSETDAQDNGYRWRFSNSGLQGLIPAIQKRCGRESGKYPSVKNPCNWEQMYLNMFWHELTFRRCLLSTKSGKSSCCSRVHG